ncbi:proton-conducting transporter membrane subunit [Sulfurimonas sp.]|uniref:complex I subunit 5 family protein n=1 Tax=Sulfurimonas sp. TaxID=2022749 RepID=UPI0019FC4713|nr:proton-conducting transporter membrane subunit [Sulfurimonas sp.]MBE0514519.1 oxidoreductase [Sulfurimonas sp.]
MSLIIPSLLFIPLLFAILTYVFQKYAQMLGVLFVFLWLLLTLIASISVVYEGELLYNFGGFAPPLGISFRIDGLRSLMALLSAFILLICSIYARVYLLASLQRDYFPLLAFLTLGISVLFFSTDIFNQYIALEIIGISAVALSALQKDKKSIDAALRYFFATLIGSGFYLFAVALLYLRYGTLFIDDLALLIENDFVTTIAFIFIVVGLSLKTALFPLHYWLPSAHSNATTPISALLSALVVKTGFFLLFSLYGELFWGIDLFVGKTLSYLGIVAIFYGGIQAFFAKDLKLMIAYSTISQLGYLFLLFVLFSPMAIEGAFLGLFGHSLAKAGMFLSAGTLIYALGTRKISDFKGISFVFPLSIFAIALSSITLIGLPPSLGFFAKWYYLQSAWMQQEWLLFSALLLGSLLSALYLFRFLILSLGSQGERRIFVKEKKIKILEWCGFILSLSSVLLGMFSYALTKMMGI